MSSLNSRAGAPGAAVPVARRESRDPRPGARRSYPAMTSYLPAIDDPRGRGAYGAKAPPAPDPAPDPAPAPLASIPVAIGTEVWQARRAPYEPGCMAVCGWELEAPGGQVVTVSELLEGGLEVLGLRRLACTCPAGAKGVACAHVASLARLGLVRGGSASGPPRPLRRRRPADTWPAWTDHVLPIACALIQDQDPAEDGEEGGER